METTGRQGMIDTKRISIMTWVAVLIGTMLLITLLTSPPKYSADNIHQVRNLTRKCSQEMGGVPTVETKWEKTRNGFKRPKGWTITCHKK
jgi:hypothetical protein